MTRLRISALLLATGVAVTAQQPAAIEPPEEDVNTERVKEYTFNPLQAAKEIKIGAFYFKKGAHKAALARFEEAVKWDPASADAWVRIAEAREKLGDRAGARAAYQKILELQPDGKQAESIRKKLKQS